MTTFKYVTACAVLALLLVGCKETTEEMPPASFVTYKLAMNLAGSQPNMLTPAEKTVTKLGVYSFAKNPGTGAFQFEKAEASLVFTTGSDVLKSTCNFVGSLPRKLYFIANETGKAPLLDGLTPALTPEQFEAQLLLKDGKPQSPFVMVSKYEITNPDANLRISTDLSISAVRLDIVNNYTDFVIDSLVVRKAVKGSFLFKATIPTAVEVPWEDVRYETLPLNTIYLYPTPATTLAVYGKYKNIRTAFDVATPAFAAATRYQLTITGQGPDNNIEQNFGFVVAPWTEGQDITSTPDWKNN